MVRRPRCGASTALVGSGRNQVPQVIPEQVLELAHVGIKADGAEWAVILGEQVADAAVD